mgnify:CR=1 FL=1|uniref:Thiamine-monophosphate kinase n=1 Tax=Candidatus Methanomethylicus mesodigestus TaxID=1867258 RepID=A0A7C3IWC5_9CREN
MSEMKASDLGERGIIDLIWSVYKSKVGEEKMRSMPLPPPDDASAVPLPDGRYLVLKADMFVKRTDAPPRMRHYQMGAKSVVMNISDLAAKGASPIAFLFSLGVPANYGASQLRQLMGGIVSATEEYGAPLLGGDVGESRDLVIAGFAAGISRSLIKRSGAKPGDILATTGSFGETAAAYKILLEGKEAPPALRKALCRSVFCPRARLREGVRLAESGAITSSMDSSDGLAFTLWELSRSSGVGFRIDHVPVAKKAGEFAKLHSLVPLDLALYGGEEYEIVFTVRPSMWEEATKAAGGRLIRLGVAVEGNSVFINQEGKEFPVADRGWEHLRRA